MIASAIAMETCDEKAGYVREGSTLHMLPVKDGRPRKHIDGDDYPRDGTIKELVIHDGIRRIGDGAFKGMSSIRELVLPNSLRHIGASAFEGCPNIYEAKLPMGLRSLGDRAFAGCRRLHVKYIPSSVERIGSGAFASCFSIEGFRMKGSPRKYSARKGFLYDNANDAIVMYPCGNSESRVDLPETTKRVLDFAFDGAHVEYIVLDEELRRIDDRAFSNCPVLDRFEDLGMRPNRFTVNCGVLFSDDGGRLVRAPPSYDEPLVLKGVVEINPYALEGCGRITKVCIIGCSDGLDLSVLKDLENLREISVTADSDVDLPFDLLDRDGKPLPKEGVPGHVFVRKRNGKFQLTGGYEYKEMDDDDGDEWGLFGEKSRSFEPVEMDGTRFDDIAGLSRAKEEIRDRLVLPSKEKELFEVFEMKAASGMLLYGPPGTGKTMLAKAVASEVDAAFFSVKPSDIMDMYVGQNEGNIRSLFEAAREHERAVIFFDDFDALGKDRRLVRNTSWHDSMIVELLTQIQGLEEHEGTLLLIAATNKPWTIDSALLRPGRFSVKVKVPLPDAESREWILRNRISQVPHSDSIDYHAISLKLEGYNGADVDEVCDQMKLHRITAISNGSEVKEIVQEDVDYALGRVSPSVSRKDVEEIDRYEITGEGPSEEGGEGYVPRINERNTRGYA